MTDAGQRRLLVLCLATVYIVWGTTYLATRVGVMNLPPFLFGGVRFIVGGGLLMLYAYRRGVRLAQFRGQWWHLHVLGFVGVALCNGAQVWAMQWVPSHTSALLNASSALWIVAFGMVGARAHRPSTLAALGLLIGFAGTALLMWPQEAAVAVAANGPRGGDAVTSGGAIIATPVFPQLMILAGCVAWSLGTIYMRNHSLTLDLFALVGMQMLIGGAWMTALGLLAGEGALWQWSWSGTLSLLYLVVFSSCFAYTAYAWLARHATPALTGTYSYVNPAIAALVGYLVLGETLTPVQMLGAVVILAGVLMVNWPARKVPAKG